MSTNTNDMPSTCLELRFAVTRDICFGDYEALLKNLRAAGHVVFCQPQGAVEIECACTEGADKRIRWNSACATSTTSVISTGKYWANVDGQRALCTNPHETVLYRSNPGLPEWHTSNQFWVYLLCTSVHASDRFTYEDVRDIREAFVSCFGLADNTIHNRRERCILPTDHEDKINLYVNYDRAQALREYSMEDEMCPGSIYERRLACWRCHRLKHWWQFAAFVEDKSFNSVLGQYARGNAPCCDVCSRQVVFSSNLDSCRIRRPRVRS